MRVPFVGGQITSRENEPGARRGLPNDTTDLGVVLIEGLEVSRPARPIEQASAEVIAVLGSRKSMRVTYCPLSQCQTNQCLQGSRGCHRQLPLPHDFRLDQLNRNYGA